MNKTMLIESISRESGLTRTDADKALKAFVSVVEKALKEGDGVTLVGFGSFVVKTTASRSGRNFKTGKLIQIPPRRSVRFRAGKKLKECVNG